MDDPIWPPSANTYGWTAYLGDRKGGADVPAYAAPARATDLAGLPPTLVAVGAIDGFSDEDIDYAVRLRHAGVPVDLMVYAGAPHGFDGLAPGAAVAQRANRDIEEWLQRPPALRATPGGRRRSPPVPAAALVIARASSLDVARRVSEDGAGDASAVVSGVVR